MDANPVNPWLESLSRGLEAGRVASRDLFTKHTELVIEHGDQIYRLRITDTGKLILTK
jgi:hemin uptake protein HemP